jgi:glycosyltransferase involved in cell wall biosynthesis
MQLTGAECVLLGPGLPLEERRDDRGSKLLIAQPRPDLVSAFRRRYTPLRYLHGRLVLLEDRRNGRWLAPNVLASAPQLFYGFSQISLETLRALTSRPETTTIVDHPLGDPRHYREAFSREARLQGLPNLWHPTRAMIDRIFGELSRAHLIRTSSEWSRNALVRWGIAADRIRVVPQMVDCQRFRPRSEPATRVMPVSVCYVGSLSLGKGFLYLLRALRAIGPERTTLRIVGTSGDPVARKVFANESRGLNVSVSPGDPAPALQTADILVLPSLHDGFGLVVAEAMASGVPVIVTDQCGAAEWVDASVGWVVAAGSTEALANALQDALDRHSDGTLSAMGASARAEAIKRSGAAEAGMLALIREGLHV